MENKLSPEDMEALKKAEEQKKKIGSMGAAIPQEPVEQSEAPASFLP